MIWQRKRFGDFSLSLCLSHSLSTEYFQTLDLSVRFPEEDCSGLLCTALWRRDSAHIKGTTAWSIIMMTNECDAEVNAQGGRAQSMASFPVNCQGFVFFPAPFFFLFFQTANFWAFSDFRPKKKHSLPSVEKSHSLNCNFIHSRLYLTELFHLFLWVNTSSLC